jgi:hypothetical protein
MAIASVMLLLICGTSSSSSCTLSCTTWGRAGISRLYICSPPSHSGNSLLGVDTMQPGLGGSGTRTPISSLSSPEAVMSTPYVLGSHSCTCE